MQTRSSDENSVRPSVFLSVCLSVCPSVKRVICDEMEERSVQILTPQGRSFKLVFWEEEWLVGGGDFFNVKFLVNRPPLERNRFFSTDIRS